MLPVQCEEIYSKLYMTALNIQRQKNVTGETGGEGFCSRCVRGELIAQRSRTVHELDDREVLGLQIRGTTGGCVDTYTWAGWLHFGCRYSGMHASQTFRWNVGFIGLAEHMSLVCFLLFLFGLLEVLQIYKNIE